MAIRTLSIKVNDTTSAIDGNATVRAKAPYSSNTLTFHIVRQSSIVSPDVSNFSVTFSPNNRPNKGDITGVDIIGVSNITFTPEILQYGDIINNPQEFSAGDISGITYKTAQVGGTVPDGYLSFDFFMVPAVVPEVDSLAVTTLPWQAGYHAVEGTFKFILQFGELADNGTIQSISTATCETNFSWTDDPLQSTPE